MPLLQLFRLLLACVLTLANFSVQARLAQNTPLEKMAFSSVDCAQVWRSQALDSYQENGFPDAALVSGPTLYNYFRTYDPDTGGFTQMDPIGLGGGLNRRGAVGGNPLMFTDSFGLAKDGVPLNSENCEALKKIIEYEKNNSKTQTLWKYNPLNFSDYSVSLDAAFPSIGGQVSIDWMMRSGVLGITANPVTGQAAYFLGKELNNSIHGNNPLLNINGEANSNAPTALSYWYHNENMTLSKMFSPALDACTCKGSSK